MCGNISHVDSLLDERDRAMLILHVQREKNLSTPSSIEQTRLNVNDSHPSISSETLIEDEEPNLTATSKSTYKYTCSSTM